MILAWLIVIPFVAGVLAWIAGGASRRAPGWIALAAMAVELAVGLAIWAGAIGRGGQTWLLQLDLPWIPAVGARFLLAMDGLGLLMVLLTAVLGGMSALASWRTAARPGLYYFNLLWMLAGVVGIFLAMDLLLLYFFWEMMIIPLYFLIGVWGGAGREAAAIKMFIFTQVSGLLLLAAALGLMFAHGRPYTLSYFDLLGTTLSPAAAMAIVLGFFAAFAVKLPAFGVHTWLVDAHAAAPVAGGVDLAGLVIKVGAYGLLRFVVPLLAQAPGELVTVGRVLAVAAILYGGLMAFAQSDLKRLVAYSSIGHMGFVLLGVLAGSALAMQGAVILIVSSGIGSGALLVLAGAIHARTGRRDLGALGGLWQVAPKLGGAGLFFALAAMGLPTLAGFVGEVLVLAGTFPVSATFAAIAAGGLIVSVIYALWLVQKVFQGPTPAGTNDFAGVRDLLPREWIMLAPAIAITLWLGLYPRPVLDLVARASCSRVLRASHPQAAQQLAQPAWPVAPCHLQATLLSLSLEGASSNPDTLKQEQRRPCFKVATSRTGETSLRDETPVPRTAGKMPALHEGGTPSPHGTPAPHRAPAPHAAHGGGP